VSLTTEAPWVSQGPGPFNLGVGAINQFAVDPNDPQRMFVATANGGNDTFRIPTGARIGGQIIGGAARIRWITRRTSATSSSIWRWGRRPGWAGAWPASPTSPAARATTSLVGDANPNVLIGGTGRNIIIGSGGAGHITGGGDNILIGGTTSYATNHLALDALFTEWTNPTLTIGQRTQALKKGILAGGQTYALKKSTVFADNAPDSLIGGAGLNWFFVDSDDTINNGAGPGPNDTITHV
jgi:hypothetical protein